MVTRKNTTKLVDNTSLQGNQSDATSKRRYLSQTDVPAYSLAKALRIAQAIADNYGKAPTRPLAVAQAVNQTPTSGTFRMLTGASLAYGLTDGGYNADVISITALGKRIVAPTSEGDDLAARREALLRPRVVREFLTKYNGSRLPSSQIAKNVLEELNVPSDRTGATLELIIESARDVGFLREVKGNNYVDLDGVTSSTSVTPNAQFEPYTDEPPSSEVMPSPSVSAATEQISNRVFITHGKNQEIVKQLKDLLAFGKFEPVVAMEHETVSKPVPDKVMDDMRSCGAAIIHIGTEMKLLDDTGSEHRILNPNVLIEIGAAMGLYHRNFILLVERGLSLPSNLQGLNEVRYDGNKLDYDATMKLLRAFNDFQK
jgi:Predicted nucleotide-binding protein containing TIR-like domain